MIRYDCGWESPDKVCCHITNKGATMSLEDWKPNSFTSSRLESGLLRTGMRETGSMKRLQETANGPSLFPSSKIHHLLLHIRVLKSPWKEDLKSLFTWNLSFPKDLSTLRRHATNLSLPHPYLLS